MNYENSVKTLNNWLKFEFFSSVRMKNSFEFNANSLLQTILISIFLVSSGLQRGLHLYFIAIVRHVIYYFSSGFSNENEFVVYEFVCETNHK